MKPRLLDLFCGAGGCSRGYQQAGFYVVGVDINPQPRYAGDEFHQADAMTFPTDGFDAIHASPPCQAFTTAGAAWTNKLGAAKERHPDLLDATRERLIAAGVPYAIENVPGAPLHNPLTLCGLAFGLKVKRHRLFESNVLLFGPPPCPANHDEDFVIVFGGGVRGRTHQIGRTANNSGPILRRPTLPLEVGQEAMEIDWMNRHELSQAIPPAYTHFIGEQLLREVQARSAA